MIRVLFWALLAWVLVVAVRRLAGGGSQRAAGRDPGAAAEDMVQCATCRLNLPKSEAIAFDGGWACCAEHARAPAGRP